MILCLYDLERWGAEVLMDALRTHRLAVVDGMVHDNPYYVEPGKFLVGRNYPHAAARLAGGAGCDRRRGGTRPAKIISGSSSPPCGACSCCPCS